MLRPTTDFRDLCFHALAHVRLPPPGDLYDAAYVTWAKSALDPDAVGPFVEDAALLSRICARSPERALALAALPILFESIEVFRHAGRAAFSDLAPDSGFRPDALAALRAADPNAVEILWADLALAARAYEDAHAAIVAPEVWRGIERVRPHLEAAATARARAHDAHDRNQLAAVVRGAAPDGLRRAELVVEAAHPLGARGRALAGRIIVGVPATFAEELDPAIPAVVALHELAVVDAGRRVDAHTMTQPDRWARAEWSALTAVAGVLGQGAPDPVLARAHARWLRDLDLDELLGAARRLGLCAEGLAERLASDPEGRVRALREAGDGGSTVG